MSDTTRWELEQFREIRIDHPKQNAALARTLFLVRNRPPGTITVLAGPTGTGKTSLINMVHEIFMKEHADAMENDPLFVPMAKVQAVKSGEHGHDFKRLYTDSLNAIGDPFAEVRVVRSGYRRPSGLLLFESAGVGALRVQLESQFRERKAKLWAIDEANLVLAGGKGDAHDQLEVLKSISQTAGLNLLLCGTHELPDWMLGSGQIARRKQVVPLNRYRFHVEEERMTFINVVFSIMSKIPTEPRFPDIVQNVEFFYLYSCGCIGVFKEWAHLAYGASLEQGRDEITLDHFWDNLKEPEDMARINHEVLEFESRYLDERREIHGDLRSSILSGKTAEGGSSSAASPQVSSTAQRPRPRRVVRGRSMRRTR